ncbi:MAG: PKD domain-containing protein [Bacteroidota bacterium]
MKHSLRNSILLFILLLSFIGQNKIHATHLVGASISYECIGPCTYRFYHTSYFDCSGAAFSTYLPLSNNSPALPLAALNNFSFVNAPGCNSPSPIGGWMQVSFREVTPLCPSAQIPMPGTPSVTGCDGTNMNPTIGGAAELVAYRDYDFCNTVCNDFTYEWSICCRNATITSLFNPNASGLYVSGNLNTSSNTCNKSPIFRQSPVTYICSGQAAFIDLGATDVDGDSLVYELGPCFDQQGIPVNYAAGHSFLQPLGNTWSLSLNSATGGLTVTPDTSGIIGAGVICVLVKEYRDGMLISETSSDFQIEVLAVCDPNELPEISSLQQLSGAGLTSPLSLQGCVGNPLEFEILVSDPDISDTLIIDTNVDSVLLGAIVSFSGTNPKIMRVNWTPTANAAAINGTFYVKSTDNFCPIPGAAVQVFDFSFAANCIEGIISPTACADSSGAIDLSVIGSSGPYSFLWNTGETTEDISGLSVGTYSVDVFDSLAVFVGSKSFLVEASDIQLSFIATPPQCGQQDGQISPSIIGGTPPFTYLWNTGSTDSTLMGLAAGGYSLTVTDAAGCAQQESLILDFPDSCFVSYIGTVFQDDNGNCVQDPGEAGVPNVYIDIIPGSAAFTDSIGNYNILADTGDHVIRASIAQGYSFICPPTDSLPVSGQNYGELITGLDFALAFDSIQDISVHMFNAPARPGRERSDNITLRNDGTIPMDGTLTFTFDTVLTITRVSPPYTNYNSSVQELSWNFQNLMPGEVRVISVRTMVPTTAQANDTYFFSALATPLMNDATPANNQQTATILVGNSFDPNDKLVSPAGLNENGFILPSQNEMDYTVRFQNTGNAPAIIVVVRDTIDSNLNLATFRPAGQSHPYILDVEEDSILVFTFNDIYLPDSTSDPIGSQGYLSFTIRHQDGLSPGTILRNSAAIYFDFNDPIITNEVINTLYTQPVVDISAADSLCAGDPIIGSVIESGMPPSDFVWSEGSVFSGISTDSSSIEATATGWYQLTVTDDFGFSATDSIQISVFESPVANFDYSFDGTSVQFSDSSENEGSRLWLFGDGNSSAELNPRHTYDSFGLYTVQLIISNVCGNDTLSTEIGLWATSIASELFSQSVKVVPHPVLAASRIEFSNPSLHAYRLEVMDIHGKTVFKRENQRTDVFEIGKEGLAPGIYLYSLDGEYRHAGKLLVR